MTIVPTLRTGSVDAVLARVRELAQTTPPAQLSAAVFGDGTDDELVPLLAYACPADALLPALVAEFPDLRLPPAALAARRLASPSASPSASGASGATLVDYFSTTPDVGDAPAILRALAHLASLAEGEASEASALAR